MPKGSKADASHAGAMFGTSVSSNFLDSISKTTDGAIKASVVEDDNLLMHPNVSRPNCTHMNDNFRV